jgi:hypothetical protein
MGPQLEAWVDKNKTIRLRQIDVRSWDSDVSRQFGISRLPTLMLYDGPDLISDDTKEILEILSQ